MILAALALAASSPLSQARAITLLGNAMKSIDPTTPIACLDFKVEKRSAQLFVIAVHEVHDYKCGGDPDDPTLRERFRVERRPLAISRAYVELGHYLSCVVRKDEVTCPDPSK